jgi:hypothetical protein
MFVTSLRKLMVSDSGKTRVVEEKVNKWEMQLVNRVKDQSTSINSD